MIGGFTGGMISWRIGNREAIRQGQVNRAESRREYWHWAGGMIVAVVSTFALACVIPALRGQAGSQVLVVLIGMVYFLWGVQRERQFLWLGLLLIAGGVCVALIPRYPWTCLGSVIAAGLIIPTFFRKSRA